MLLSLHSLKSQTFYVFIKLACKELNAKRPLERVAVHAIPITVGGQAECAVGGLTTAATTEKTACVAGNLVASDGDVLEGYRHPQCLPRAFSHTPSAPVTPEPTQTMIISSL